MTSKDSRSRKQKEARELTIPVNIGSDHIRGSINNAPIILVEYGDYECPYTGMAHPVVKEIMRKFGDDLKQQKLLRLKINSGKCMITCLNIRKH